jgi:hypothetical protein
VGNHEEITRCVIGRSFTTCCIAQSGLDGTHTETGFRLLVKWMGPHDSVGQQFSRLLAAQVYGSASSIFTVLGRLCPVVLRGMLDTHSILLLSLHFPSHVAMCHVILIVLYHFTQCTQCVGSMFGGTTKLPSTSSFLKVKPSDHICDCPQVNAQIIRIWLDHRTEYFCLSNINFTSAETRLHLLHTHTHTHPPPPPSRHSPIAQHH